MFLDCSAAAREGYFRGMDNCLIPGYTGHCPTLKFSFGKSYGANTKEIIKDMRFRSSPRRVHYEDPVTAALRTRSKDSQDLLGHGLEPRHDQMARQRTRPYVLGYTGFIPGLNFLYGTSFGHAVDCTLAHFKARSAEQANRRRTERDLQNRPPPPQLSIRGRDVIPDTIAQAEAPLPNKYKDTHISATLPPIAGYTGHIPRLKGTEASLSQRYHTAVTSGLEMLQKERDLRTQQEAAQKAVHNVLASAGPRYTIPAY